MQKLNTAISSQMNRSLVLSVIHRNPLISRALIADRTGLDRSAVTHILKELIERGLVDEVEEGKASARGGRRPVHLRVRYDAHRLIVVSIDVESMELAVTDLAGRVARSLSFEIGRGEDPVKLLTKALDAARQADRKGFAEVLAIAASLPGIVDEEQGRVLLNLYHGWRNIDLKEPLEARYGKPVFVENDANVAALAEWSHHESQGSGFDSLVYLLIRGRAAGPGLPLGIGGAFVQRGRLWHGAHHCSGELAPAIARRFEKVVDDRGLMELMTSGDGRNALTVLMKAVGKGDDRARKAVAAISDVIGQFLAELAAFMDPAAVVVSMLPPENCGPFMEMLDGEFRRHYDLAGLGHARLIPAARQADAPIEGLVALALEQVFIRDRTRPSLLFAGK